MLSVVVPILIIVSMSKASEILINNIKIQSNSVIAKCSRIFVDYNRGLICVQKQPIWLKIMFVITESLLITVSAITEF